MPGTLRPSQEALGVPGTLGPSQEALGVPGTLGGSQEAQVSHRITTFCKKWKQPVVLFDTSRPCYGRGIVAEAYYSNLNIIYFGALLKWPAVPEAEAGRCRAGVGVGTVTWTLGHRQAAAP